MDSVKRDSWDVIVIGAGHAGCEAINAACKRGVSVCLVLDGLDKIARLSCNPSVGGVGKGHLVAELDALGGIMGIATDRATVNAKMLNESKGHAVRAPRCQVDSKYYPQAVTEILLSLPGLSIVYGFAEELIIVDGEFKAVVCDDGRTIYGKQLILATGTFLGGMVRIGSNIVPGGRIGEKAANGIRNSLFENGVRFQRLKTGTSPRIDRDTVDYSVLEEHADNPHVKMSQRPVEQIPEVRRDSAYSCYTSEETRNIVFREINKDSYFDQAERAPGPRYCPSLESKCMRFPNKKQHQLFVEFMGSDSKELYISGLSMGFGEQIQDEIVRSIPGFESAVMLRPAYDIEYEIVAFGQIHESMRLRNLQGIYVCGQINGTTGYEEAAVQGLIAGVNAANAVLGEPDFVPSSFSSYIGVLLDDLVCKDHTEPYRMFTSRTPWRLMFSIYNVNKRMEEDIKLARLLNDGEIDDIVSKNIEIDNAIKEMSSSFVKNSDRSMSIGDLLKRPEHTYDKLMIDFPDRVRDFGNRNNTMIAMHFKYQGYIQQLHKEWKTVKAYEGSIIKDGFDFSSLKTISDAAKEHLSTIKPNNLGKASRIAGITSSDYHHLVVELIKMRALVLK